MLLVNEKIKSNTQMKIHNLSALKQQDFRKSLLRFIKAYLLGHRGEAHIHCIFYAMNMNQMF